MVVYEADDPDGAVYVVYCDECDEMIDVAFSVSELEGILSRYQRAWPVGNIGLVGGTPGYVYCHYCLDAMFSRI